AARLGESRDFGLDEHLVSRGLCEVEPAQLDIADRDPVAVARVCGFERLQRVRIVRIEIDDGLPRGDATWPRGLELCDLDAQRLLVLGVSGEARGLAKDFDQ